MKVILLEEIRIHLHLLGFSKHSFYFWTFSQNSSLPSSSPTSTAIQPPSMPLPGQIQRRARGKGRPHSRSQSWSFPRCTCPRRSPSCRWSSGVDWAGRPHPSFESGSWRAPQIQSPSEMPTQGDRWGHPAERSKTQNNSDYVVRYISFEEHWLHSYAMRQVPLECDINIAVNRCSGFATSTQKGPYMAMLISHSRGTYLIVF